MHGALRRHLAEAVNKQHALSLMLAAGGDMRIWPNAASGRNRYGTRMTPSPDEISFSSTTASNISAEGFAAAGGALNRLFGTAPEPAISPEEWFDELRDGIVEHLGLPGSQAVLAASGTDAELLALGLVTGLARRPVTNIFIAPDETGNGIPLAAAGRHFSNLTALGEGVVSGEPIEGLSPERIDVRAIAIRDASGRPRDLHLLDDDVVVMVERELRCGRDVLLHVLDASKTGLTGVTRETARGLVATAPGRVRVVIDACQLRNPPAQLRRDLADGFMVTVTGSKFAAGPPFAGALLLPAALAEELAACVAFAAGLADYTAFRDWPAPLRGCLGISFKSEANLGLGLRWIAALESIASYASVGESIEASILDYFARLVRAMAAGVRGLTLHPDDALEHLASRSIIPLTVLTPAGDFAPLIEAQRMQVALRESADGPVCHVGQAVRVGPRNVLRVAASAVDVAGVAARLAAGESLKQAFRPVANDLDVLFAKWSKIAHRTRAD